MLLDPPFASDPPVKFNIAAKRLGLIYAIFFAIVSLFIVTQIVGLVGARSPAGVGDINFVRVIGNTVALIGTIVIACGGSQMHREKDVGKRSVVYAVVAMVGGLITSALGGGVGRLAGVPRLVP